MEKRGQMQMSFGMIFSIFLIIVFLAAAIYAITKFISFQKELSYRQFSEDFQSQITEMWKGHQGNKILSYDLPSNAENACIETPSQIVIYKKAGGHFETDLEHVDIGVTMGNQNSFCINVINGNLTLGIKKLSNQPEVIIVRVQ